MDEPEIRISKLNAARRQLDCAIELWFAEKDAVAVHTLAHASYQIIHDINRKRGNSGKLLYSNDVIRPERRKEFDAMLKEPGNFFKHADEDPDGTVGLTPFHTRVMIGFSIMGLGMLGESVSTLCNVFKVWTVINEPEIVNEEFREFLCSAIDAETTKYLAELSRPDFLKHFLRVSLNTRREGLWG